MKEKREKMLSRKETHPDDKARIKKEAASILHNAGWCTVKIMVAIGMGRRWTLDRIRESKRKEVKNET